MKRIQSLAFLFLAMILLVSSCTTATETAPPATSPDTTTQATTSAEETLPPKDTLPPLVPGPNPRADDELNVLLIGNSYSYYWTDELWGLLDAAGYKNVSICNVYYSGCTFEQHWTWYETGQANYSFFTVTDGHETVHDRITEKKVDLNHCLNSKVWDVISLQQSNKWAGSETKHRDNISPYLPKLYDLLYKHSPNAIFYWQQNWAHEVGLESIKSTDTQRNHAFIYKLVGKEFCKEYGFQLVPLGDAWNIVRHNALFYKTELPIASNYPMLSLHTRIQHSGSKKGEITNTDLSHDGDAGGGQYLNACVWFECLTKRSCVGNTFRPQYAYKDSYLTLTEEQIAALQKTAHSTVASHYGEMPAESIG